MFPFQDGEAALGPDFAKPHIPLNQLKQSKLQEFYNETKKGDRLLRTELYGEGLSNRTVRNCHLCRGALEQAVKAGLLQSNPAYGCALPPKKAREMQVLAREEIQRFLIQAREEGYYELFLLELATGLRRGELLALQWSDLNFDTGELHITKQICRINGKLTVSEPKTKASNRTIILPPVLLGVLKKHRARTHSRWLFPSPRIEDQPLDPASCRKCLQRILNRAQCKRIRFHDLRHPYVKHTIKNISLQKQKSQTTNRFDSLGFLFSLLALCEILIMKMPDTDWHFHYGFSRLLSSQFNGLVY